MVATQTPAVVIIARHGPRLDAADQTWHLSTPTPYDPPLTYGGWGQSRALGVRIATLLDARDGRVGSPTSTPPSEGSTQPVTNGANGVLAQDFAVLDGLGKSKDNGAQEGTPRRKKRKHRVVIHTSPFLRCIQTSIAIAAGMAQYKPTIDTSGSISSTTPRARTPGSLHSASPRLRTTEGAMSPNLAPIPEPKHDEPKYDFAHEMARRTMEHKFSHQNRAKLRVDAFLGEWLNPQYFEHITPPPPSALMVAAAKAELVSNETIAAYVPTFSAVSSKSNLWGGTSGAALPISQHSSKDGSLDEMTGSRPTRLALSPKRERANSASSAGSFNGESGRQSPFRRGHTLHPNPATVTQPAEPAVYIPPTPHYAVSGSDKIPRGYVGHAREACLDVDYTWDSSRPPQNWVDGGQYGEEWSAMHKRFRRGLNHLIHWYSQHGPDQRAEDALGIEQVEKHQDEDEEDEEEDLVVILVTHGAGSNALIGALTGQPVLLDVGMASLTMAVRKDDAPSLASIAEPSTSPTKGRRGSLDLGLSSIYDMKLVASSEHLRPGSDARRISTPSAAIDHFQPRTARPTFQDNQGNTAEPVRLHMNSNLGSMRRPTAPALLTPSLLGRSESEPVTRANASPAPVTPGLWTPPAGRTPILAAEKLKEERENVLIKLNEVNGRLSLANDLAVDLTESPIESRPTTSDPVNEAALENDPEVPKPRALAMALNGEFSEPPVTEEPVFPRAEPVADSTFGTMKLPIVSESKTNGQFQLPRKDSAPPTVVSDQLPQNLSRGLSQKGLWGSKPKGDRVERQWSEPKRRWSSAQKAVSD
ncbi:Hypothetical protein R9X50_00282900 [Acrodontium crateriforme]|uniref:Phosphoglycerate mutase family protein n=1 Tax=Acrodontium crateriforme TaxID=150365 RepID=A0AAQ3R3S9_9PEZI|nr:Hypothetical protein R9X50_00282900 [Acrodontium crateriforme]